MRNFFMFTFMSDDEQSYASRDYLGVARASRITSAWPLKDRALLDGVVTRAARPHERRPLRRRLAPDGDGLIALKRVRAFVWDSRISGHWTTDIFGLLKANALMLTSFFSVMATPGRSSASSLPAA